MVRWKRVVDELRRDPLGEHDLLTGAVEAHAGGGGRRPVDLEPRVAAHNGGCASRYTRSRLPVELARARELPDRRAARREEVRIKRLPRAAKLALIAGDYAPA